MQGEKITGEMEGEFSLSSDFWAKFVGEYWDRKPGVFEKVLSRPLLSSEELLQGLYRMARQLVQKADEPPGGRSFYRLFVSNRLVNPPEYRRFLPRGKSLQEYSSAIGQSVGGETFAIVINEFQTCSPTLWERVQQFVRPLIESVGIPSQLVETAVFMGTYQSTPFGIHQDLGNGVLTFAVEGQKRFLLWPPEYFDSKNPGGTFLKPDPKTYRADALEIEIEPGDMMYWPPNWYHTSYSEETDLHACFSIGFWKRIDLASTVAEAARELLAKNLGNSTYYDGYWQSDENLPGELASTLAALREIVVSDQLERRLHQRWLERCHACGFNRVPDRGWRW